MTIDKSGYNSLTRYKDTVVKSDHMKLEMEADIIFHKEDAHDHVSVFNVKNKTGQQKFFDYTYKTNILSKCFKSNDQGAIVNFEKWQSKFKFKMHALKK